MVWQALSMTTSPSDLLSTCDQPDKKPRASGGGISWAHSGGEREKKSPGVQEDGGQPYRCPLALFLAFYHRLVVSS
eukprot:1152147-Pelagomonas_calceolata.AAC.2